MKYMYSHQYLRVELQTNFKKKLYLSLPSLNQLPSFRLYSATFRRIRYFFHFLFRRKSHYIDILSRTFVLRNLRLFSIIFVDM